MAFANLHVVNLRRVIALLCLGVLLLASGFCLGLTLWKNRSQCPSWQDMALASTMSNRRAYTLPLNNPDMIPAFAAGYMQDDDVVLGTFIGGQARAYPWWLTSNYHVINDTVGDEPVLITLCEVCGGAAAFRPVLPELPDTPLSFQICGVGLGTIEIMDYQTHSRWRPFLGVSFDGPLKERSLDNYPLLIMTWKEWRRAYPQTLVVNGSPQLRARLHGAEAGRIGDPALPQLFARTANLTDTRLGLHELVFGIRLTNVGKSFAIPLKRLTPYPGLFRVTLDSNPVLIFREGELAVTAFNLNQTPYRAGFSLVSSNPAAFRTPDNRTWTAFGVSHDPGLPERKLPAARGYLTEWYEWVSHSPNTAIIDSIENR